MVMSLLEDSLLSPRVTISHYFWVPTTAGDVLFELSQSCSLFPLLDASILVLLYFDFVICHHPLRLPEGLLPNYSSGEVRYTIIYLIL